MYLRTRNVMHLFEHFVRFNLSLRANFALLFVVLFPTFSTSFGILFVLSQLSHFPFTNFSKSFCFCFCFRLRLRLGLCGPAFAQWFLWTRRIAFPLWGLRLKHSNSKKIICQNRACRTSGQTYTKTPFPAQQRSHDLLDVVVQVWHCAWPDKTMMRKHCLQNMVLQDTVFQPIHRNL